MAKPKVEQAKVRPMSKAKLEAQQAIDHLRTLLPPGTTVHTVLRHVARSGMQRRIDVYLLRDQEDVYLSGYVAKALGMRRHASKEGLVVNGCGMDMGYDIVHNLGIVLYPQGFGCCGERCPSNDHSNGDRDYTRHVDHSGGNPEHRCAKEPATCNAPKHWHSFGGYALRHEWI